MGLLGYFEMRPLLRSPGRVALGPILGLGFVLSGGIRTAVVSENSSVSSSVSTNLPCS